MTRRLGKYEIFQEIGRGGFATVYRAHDPDLDREVALKVLDPLLMRDPSLVERFRREARAAARLRHPGIVTIHEIGQAEGILFIAMELLPGPSLAEIIERDAPLPVERAVDLLRPLAGALDYAHGQRLIHRDVKPSNAILDEDGAPVLTDFGLVKAAEESGSSAVSLTLSQTGMTLGTPAYMAPEQADPRAQTPVDYRADLYSLGVVAYEMLAGGVPFQGNTPMAVAMGHLLEAPPPPREWNPALPAPTEAALLKALGKKPEARFPSAAALVEGLAPEAKLPDRVTLPSERQATPVTVGAEAARTGAVLGAPFVAGTRPPTQRVKGARTAVRVPVWDWLLILLVVAPLAVGLAILAVLAIDNPYDTRYASTEVVRLPSPTEPMVEPSVAPVTHVVQAGDTISGLAFQYDVTEEEIIAANELENPNFLQVGTELMMPMGGLQSVPATSTPVPKLPTSLPSFSGSSVAILEILEMGQVEQEQVLIANIGDRLVDMQGWTLGDVHGNAYTFPSFRLWGGGSVTVHTRVGQDGNPPANLYWGRFEAVWAPGDSAILKDNQGQVVDSYVVQP